MPPDFCARAAPELIVKAVASNTHAGAVDLRFTFILLCAAGSALSLYESSFSSYRLCRKAYHFAIPAGADLMLLQCTSSRVRSCRFPPDLRSSKPNTAKSLCRTQPQVIPKASPVNICAASQHEFGGRFIFSRTIPVHIAACPGKTIQRNSTIESGFAATGILRDNDHWQI